MAERFPNTNAANKYAREVVSGRIAACHWVKKACERHINDLKREGQKRFAYRFDRRLADRACKFVQLLPHTKGRWAQKRELIKLSPWQQFALACIFGWVRKKDGLRRFREVYIEVPRKNGKSLLAGGVGLYCFSADNEFGAEVYSGATTEKQAWEVFRPARLMALRTPALCQQFGIDVHASNLSRPEDGSRFEPLIGNPGDGSSPSCALVDEFHEHDKPDLYDTMATGMGARDQPLMLIITTAGSNLAGPCYEKRLEVQKILDGVFEDDTVFGLIYSIDEDDDWTSDQALRKANPNYGVSVSAEYLKAQVAKAVRSPSKQNTVKTKHFNIWVGAKSAWLNMEHWRRCADPSLDVEAFRGEHCILTVDLASRIDVAARGRLFYRVEKDGKLHYYFFPKFYLPESALETSKNAQRFSGWAEEGHLELVDGDEIDFNQIEREILDDASEYQVVEFAYDPWQATQMAQSIQAEAGPITLEFRNTVQNMSPAMKELEAAIQAGRFHHPDNPVLNWMASNVVAKLDKKENIFPNKEAPENKIDGMIALIMGVGRALAQPQPAESIYETTAL